MDIPYKTYPKTMATEFTLGLDRAIHEAEKRHGHKFLEMRDLGMAESRVFSRFSLYHAVKEC